MKRKAGVDLRMTQEIWDNLLLARKVGIGQWTSYASRA
jgi:hypothetical protein